MDLSAVSKNNKVYQLINKLRKVRRINEPASTAYDGNDNADYSDSEEAEEEFEQEENRKRDQFNFDQAYDDDVTTAATEEENDAQAAALAQRDDAWDAFTLTPEEQAHLLTVQSHILWLKPGKVPARYSFIKTVSAKTTTPQYLTTLVFLIHAFLEESESRWPQKCPVVVFGSAEPLTALEQSKSLRARLTRSRAVLKVI